MTDTTPTQHHVAELCLIKVEADSAEYWEGPSSTVAYVAQTVRAAVTRDSDHDPIENDTVQL